MENCNSPKNGEHSLPPKIGESVVCTPLGNTVNARAVLIVTHVCIVLMNAILLLISLNVFAAFAC